MKVVCLVFLLFCSMLCSAQTAQESHQPIHQLRIYEIPEENRQAFHDRFKDHAHRIMKKYGFTIVTMWESSSEGKLEFIYLLEWPNEAAMKKAWENFMADQEWKDIKAETGKLHGTFVNRITDRTLKLTDYSPQQTLLQKTSGFKD